MTNTVRIDFSPESTYRYKEGYTVVAIDVVRATTTAITAVASGRRCFPVASLSQAWGLAGELGNAVLAGEQNGALIEGFDLNNSPADVEAFGQLHRPLILLSSSGTKLCAAASACEEAVLACLRNYKATALYLAQCNRNIAVIGAGTKGEFREEDQLCCAWVAEALLDLGYKAEDEQTIGYVRRWQGASVDSWIDGKSADYLRRSAQLRDLDFVLGHINDLDCAFPLRRGEVEIEPLSDNHMNLKVSATGS
jgi:2-phosphosulfolactate phosphatase